MAAFDEIQDTQVRKAVRTLYMGSGLLFLGTLITGIMNTFMDEISRGQILFHFHAGSIGWVTLSVIATTIWQFTGNRPVGPTYRNNVWLLTGIGLIAVAGYIAAFGLAFNDIGGFWLLPLFGIPSGLVIIGACVFAGYGLKHQELVTSPQILLFGALLVASLGSVMGILLGLSYSDVIHVFPDNAEADPLGAHAGPMDMYLALAFAAIAEALLLPATRRSKAAIAQVSLGVTSGFLASLALFIGIGPMVPLALLLFLASFIIYFVRVGWRALRVAPTNGRDASVFFGGLAFPFYIGLFIYVVARYFSQGLVPPHVLEVSFVHITFVAMATNWVFAVQSRFHGSDSMASAEAIGAWVMNMGLLAFIVGDVGAGIRHGSLVMAAGVLISWSILMRRARGVLTETGNP